MALYNHFESAEVKWHHQPDAPYQRASMSGLPPVKLQPRTPKVSGNKAFSFDRALTWVSSSEKIQSNQRLGTPAVPLNKAMDRIATDPNRRKRATQSRVEGRMDDNCDPYMSQILAKSKYTTTYGDLGCFAHRNNRYYVPEEDLYNIRTSSELPWSHNFEWREIDGQYKAGKKVVKEEVPVIDPRELFGGSLTYKSTMPMFYKTASSSTDWKQKCGNYENQFDTLYKKWVGLH